MNWHTRWNPVKKHAETPIDIKKRASGVKAIGVDEHIWRPSRISSTDKAVTVMIDLTRDDQGRLCARLLDAMQARSGTVLLAADGTRRMTRTEALARRRSRPETTRYASTEVLL